MEMKRKIFGGMWQGNTDELPFMFYYSITYLNPLKAELNPICQLLVLLGDLTFMGPCILSIFQYISKKMQRYTVYLYLETVLHISGGTSTGTSTGTHITVSTASGICHTVTAICRFRGRDGTGLSVLWVAYATHSTLKPVPTLPRKRQIAVTV
jgi:hypothetical protein